MSTATAKKIITPDERYSVLPYLSRRMARVGRRMGFKAKTKAEHARWRRELLKTLKSLTGYDTMRTCPLRPRITETVELDDHVRQRVEVQTEPGITCIFYCLIPRVGTPPFPAVLCPHGHSSVGKFSPAGRHDIPEVAGQIKKYNYAYGVQFVREGFVVICPDARGFGERMEPTMFNNTGGNVITSSCQYINQMAYPLGQTITGMWAWDLHRLVDYLETRKDVDASRIGCAGLSGGGLQTLWATALDDRSRIKAAVVSGYFYGYKESLLEKHSNCSCNYVPRLYEHIDMGDLGALCAPRPLLIETGDKDPLNGRSGLKNVTPQVKIARAAYRLLGAEKNLVHDVFPGEHRWHGKVAVPWMKRLLA